MARPARPASASGATNTRQPKEFETNSPARAASALRPVTFNSPSAPVSKKPASPASYVGTTEVVIISPALQDESGYDLTTEDGAVLLWE